MQPAPLNPRRLEQRRVLDASAAEILLGPLGESSEFVQVGENLSSETPPGVVANSTPTNVEVFLGDTEIFENDILQLGVTFEDADVDDIHTAVIDWGDGTAPETIQIDPGTRFLGTSHQYLDDNPTGSPEVVNLVKVTIFDSAGNQAEGAATLVVKNLAPTINSLSITSPVREGELVTLRGTFRDPGTQDTYDLDIDWNGDHVYDQTIEVSDGEFRVSRRFHDDNPSGTWRDSFDVNVRLRDDDTGVDTSSIRLTVRNVPPLNVDIDPIQMIDEYGIAKIRVTFDDPGWQDTHVAAINWGDGSSLELVEIAPGARSFMATHQYLDDPSGTIRDRFLVRVGIVDDDIGFNITTERVLVKNVAPVLLLSDQEVDEGAVLDLTGGRLGIFTDVGVRDTHRATVNWGDGSATESVVVNQGAGGGTLDGSHVYLDDGLYTVTVTLQDDDGGIAEEQFRVQVKNVAPDLSLDPVSMINENGEATLRGRITDPGRLDTYSLEIVWGDPLSPDNLQSFILDSMTLSEGMDGINWDPATRTFSLSHQYLDDNPTGTSSDVYTIDVKVLDDDLGEDVASESVQVKNVAPDLSLDPVSMINENGEATLRGRITDPGRLDTYSLEISWGDPLSPDNMQSFILDSMTLSEGMDGINWDPATRTFSLSHQYLDDNPTGTSSDVYTIDVKVLDDDLGEDVASESVQVKNVAPDLSLDPVSMINENGEATLRGRITDPGRLDTYSLEISWGDPLSPDNMQSFILDSMTLSEGMDGINWDPATRTFSLSHQYLDDNPTGTSSDVYTIDVKVLDDDLGEDVASESVQVKNVAPDLSLDPVSMINENGEATLRGRITDPGRLDTYSLEISWGDPLSPDNMQSFILDSMTLSEGMDGINWDPATRTFSLSHQYLDDNPTGTSSDVYTIDVKVLDDDLGEDVASESVQVKNVAPDLSLDPVSMINENGEATLRGRITDPGRLDTYSLEISWGDPLSPDNMQSFILDSMTLSEGMDGINWDPATRTFSLSHQYLDDNPTGTSSDVYTIDVKVLDDDLGEDVASESVQVKNVAPDLSLDPVSMINENGEATLRGRITDPGRLDTYSLEIVWGDPLSPDNLQSFILDSMTLSEGMDGINWDPATRTFSLSHQYLDDNPTGTSSDVYTIDVKVLDDDLGEDVASESVQVKNVAPDLSLDPVSMINENGEATLRGRITDPGRLDTYSLEISWGDPLSPDNMQSFILDSMTLSEGMDGINWDPATRTFSLSHQYLDDNPTGTSSDVYTIDVKVLDDDLGEDVASESVQVKNVAPDLSLDPVSMINENGEATLRGRITDPGRLDTYSLEISWGDPLSPDNLQSFILDSMTLSEGMDGINWDPATRTFSLSHQYLDDNPTGTSSDVYTIDVKVLDDDLGEDVASESVQVKNVAPDLSLDPVSMINENGEATLRGRITDPGRLDTYSLEISWGDPLSPDNMQSFILDSMTLSEGMDGINWDPATRTFSLSHQYLDDNPTGTSSDVYTIDVKVLDDDLGEDVASESVQVKNVAPDLSLDPVSMINENGEATLRGRITDPGRLDTYSLEISWGDPLSPDNMQSFILDSTTLSEGMDGINWDPATRTFSLSHQYLDDNPSITPSDMYQIDVKVTDDDGGMDTEVAFVDVRNVPLQVVLADIPDVNENGTATLNGTYTDTGVLDFHQITIEWDDPNNSLISVFEVPPLLTFDQPSGNPIAVLMVGDTLLSMTPGDLTELTITSIDLATGTVGFQASHQYVDDGIAGIGPFPGANGTLFDVSTIRVTVEDDDMGVGSSTVNVNVVNLDPVIDTLSVLPTTINESESISLSGTFSDVGMRDFHSVEIRWGDGLVDGQNGTFVFTQDFSGSGSFYATHTYADNDTESADDAAKDNLYTIVVTLTDDDGGKYVRTVDLEVLNHDPVLEPIAPEDATEVNTSGETFVTITFSDIGADQLTIWVDWGDIRDPSNPFLPGDDPFVEETPIAMSTPLDGPGTYTVVLAHTYTGPPNPLSPAADIEIRVVIIDDDFSIETAGQVDGPLTGQPIVDPGRSEFQSVTITNQGIGNNPIVIDTTPQVPRLNFPQRQEIIFVSDVSSGTEGILQTIDLRAAVGDTNSTTDQFLELRVIDPATGEESTGIRLKPEVLEDLPGLFRTLPDNHYAIYLVRTETNTRRLVIEVYVRNGKLIDPGDDSEGTRDRPPTDEAAAETIESPLNQGEVSEQPAANELEQDSELPDSNVGAAPHVENPAASSWTASPLAGRRLRMLLGTSAVGIAASQAGRSWAERIDRAMAMANAGKWRRLRTGRSRHRQNPNKRKND